MIKEKVEERHEILSRICDEMLEEFYAANISEKDKVDDLEVLRVLFDDMGYENEDGAIGEFLFMPFKTEEDEVQYFASAITLTDNLNKENMPKLLEAMAIMNFYLPYGAFSIDLTKSILAYKLITPLPVDLEGEALYEQVNICMGNAVACTDNFCDYLLKIDAGEMEIEEMLELVGLQEE